MALSGTTNKQSFTATASQTAFVFTIPFFNATRASDSGTTLKFGDIKVTRQAASGGAITALTPADSPSTVNQFKVTATNGDPAQGATITIGSGATVNDIYVVERDVAYTQEYDLQEGATIDPTALNKALDRVVAQNQQQNDQFTRTVTFPSTDSDTITYNVTDSSANRANKFLGFDSDGDITTLSAVSGSAAVDTNRGLQLVGGQIGLKDDGVTQAFMADDAIGADQLASDSVVSASIVNGSIATDDIADDAVTLAKIQNIATSKVLGRTTASSGIIEELAFLDEDNMASNNATGVASQQSIKAYVDAVTTALNAIGGTLPAHTSGVADNGTQGSFTLPTLSGQSSGLIVKYGTVATAGSGFVAVTFTAAFPTAIVAAIACPMVNAGSGAEAASISSATEGDVGSSSFPSKTGIGVRTYSNNSGTGMRASWICIGY